MMKKKGAAKGGVRKMRGGGMTKKGYAKGGVAKMRGGGVATKGAAKGGAKMTVSQLRSAAKRLGMKVVRS